MTDLSGLLGQTSVIPVMVVKQLDGLDKLAELLSEYGMGVLEVTLRTDIALDAVAFLKQRFPELTIGTGTNLCISDIQASADVGADFMVSPGATDELLDYCAQNNQPLLPGVASASEVMRAMAKGFKQLKLFPAEAVGGVKLLKSLSGPIPDAQFCPTGGINLNNALDYLNLDNVLCVGGSWMLPNKLIETQDWVALEQLLKGTHSELNIKH